MKPIGGKLSKPGYTLIALADNGRATSVQVKGRRFKLRPPASEVTLQLRAPEGTYAGPIVLRERGNPVKRAKNSIRNGKKDLKRAKTPRALKQAKRRLKEAKQELKRDSVPSWKFGDAFGAGK